METLRQYRAIGDHVSGLLDTHGGDVEKQQSIYDALGVEKGAGESSRLLVKFARPKDAFNPRDWSVARKWKATAVGFTGFLVGWSSSIDSAVIPQAKAEFGVSTTAESLATGLFLIGFGFGSFVSGPLSETFGRVPIYISTLALFAVWVMGSALAPNFGSQLVFRLFAGFFGATPLTTFGGTIADLWSLQERTFVFPIMAATSFLGPFLAPTVGAFIGQSSLISWRWTEWTTLIMTGLCLGGIVLFAPETYAPILLQWKAEHLRRITRDKNFEQPIHPSFIQKIRTSTTRPFQLFFQEPIIVAFDIYLGVVYVILFSFLTGYDFIFGPDGVYGFSQGAEGLCFIGLNVGFLITLAVCPWIYVKYKRSVTQAGTAEPEQRLWYAMISAPFCPIALFWMGWTSFSSISWWSPLSATVAFGFSMMGIFITSYQYLIDVYEGYAASALVSLTFFRYLVAGVMVVVSEPMYSSLGVHWTLTLLGCIAVILTPIPYVLYWYGPAIRARSKFGVSP